MKFELSITLGNDAMRTGNDVADALRRIVDRIQGPHAFGADGQKLGSAIKGGTIHDLNGNRCGAWEIAQEDAR